MPKVIAASSSIKSCLVPSRSGLYLVSGFKFSTQNTDIPQPYQDPNPIHYYSSDFRHWLEWNLFPQFSNSVLNSKRVKGSEITWEQVTPEMWIKQSKIMLFIAFHYTRTSTDVWKTKWKTWQIWKIPPAACNKASIALRSPEVITNYRYRVLWIVYFHEGHRKKLHILWMYVDLVTMLFVTIKILLLL